MAKGGNTPTLPRASAMHATRHARTSSCELSAWSSDGFGHQLSGLLSCEALAIYNTTYRFVRTRHIALEHTPVDSDALLEFLNRGRDAVDVEPKRYHGVCDGDKSKKLPRCSSGQLTVCDNCYRMVDMDKEPHVKREVAERLRRRLIRAVGAPTCARRFDTCVHMRGLGDPGVQSKPGGLFITPRWAEKDSMRRRTLASSWWHRAIEQAAAERPESQRNSPLAILLHTNNINMARSVFGPDGTRQHGRRDELITRDANTSLLAMMHELIFCCDTLIVSISALSSVAALATQARAIYAGIDSNPHFRMRYTKVPCASRRDTNRPECRPPPPSPPP